MIKRFILLFIVGANLWYSCGTTYQKKSDAEYQRDIEILLEKLIDNPGDQSILQELGIAHYELRNYKSALKYLVRAFKKDPNDAKTMTYLGMTLEAQKKNAIALKIYQRYTKISDSAPFYDTLIARYQFLHRKIIRDEMKQLLKNEHALNASNIKPKSVAVFPMTYRGTNKEYKALGKGISEMMITDLSQVNNLTIIDRIRLQALMEETSLGQSGMVDESTAPRFGKLLGASKIVHGGFDVVQENNLQLNVAFWDILNDNLPEFTEKQDQLDNLFKLAKELVFSIIEDMDIELTPFERQRIQHIPTKNIQAFMAYCMGLNEEDAGNFSQAAQYFQQSVNLDPQFKNAAQHLSNTRTLSGATELNSDPSSFAPSQFSDTGQENSLVNNRLNNLNSNIGSFFIPGQDSRETSEEAEHSGVDLFEDLLPPPDLPERP